MNTLKSMVTVVLITFCFSSVIVMAQEKALVTHWKFDETSGLAAKDELGSSDGILMNMTGNEWVAGQDSNAIDMSAAKYNSFIEVPDNDIVDFDSTTSFTISALVKTDPVSYTNEIHVVFKGYYSVKPEVGGEGKWYSMAFKQGQARFYVDDNVNKSQLSVVIAHLYPVNEWVHMVGVRDLDEDSLKLYMNGELYGSMEDITDRDISSKLPLFIGNHPDFNHLFKGQIDDLRMYNYALNANEVKELFDTYDIKSKFHEDTPSERIYHEMVYHSKSDRVLLFGGLHMHGMHNPPIYDVWAFDVAANVANNWKKIGVLKSGHGSAAYDEESDRVIMRNMDGETWAYQFETNRWEKMSPVEAPSTNGHRMVYDSESDRVVLFGGFTGEPLSATWFDETWTYDYNTDTWTNMNPDPKPAARAFPVMAYDAESDRTIVWGGRPHEESEDVKIWAYDYNTNTWTSKEPTTGPSRRFTYSSMIYHSGSDRIIMFGGLQLTGEFTGSLIDQTWSYDFNTNTWIELTPVPSPTARSHHDMAYSSLADKVVQFSGETVRAYSNILSKETWIYDPNTNEWTEVPMTSIDDEYYVTKPRDVTLFPNYPNPFNPLTTITYFLPKTEYVKIVVYNLLGQEVRMLVNEEKPAGFYEVTWDGKDNHNQLAASGVYLYKLQTKDFVEARKMLFLQ